MKKMIEKIMCSYGSRISINLNGDALNFYGFFQPVTSKSEQYVIFQPGITGLENTKKYLYIGPSTPMVQRDDELTVDGKKFIVKSSEPVLYEDDVVYIWGICVEKGREMI